MRYIYISNKRRNKGFTLVELIVVIVILAILIGVTIGGIYMYIGKAYTNRDIKTLKDTARQLEEISWTKPITWKGSPVKNWTCMNVVADRAGGFYYKSYGVEHTSSGHNFHESDIGAYKERWQLWFLNEMQYDAQYQNVFPKAKNKAFVYFWHLNNEGVIDFVVTMYLRDINTAVQLIANRTDIPGLKDLREAETITDAQKALNTLVNSSWVKQWWNGRIEYSGIE